MMSIRVLISSVGTAAIALAAFSAKDEGAQQAPDTGHLTATRMQAGPCGTHLEPLDMRWTFGAHEPFSMYRRVGRSCTGGIDGNAEWVKSWLNWWDREAPARMKELGLNWLHSRFYKGMGWANEKKDFPNVRNFVRNCHENGIGVLAYVQFSTLYPEVMRKEIPAVDGWRQIGFDGRPNHYWRNYFRDMPCICCKEWLDYLKRICTIALTEGGFDGVMFDNFFAMPCYCKRCREAFRKYLQRLPDKEERFGFDDLSDFRIPEVKAEDELFLKDVRDPVLQAWIRWRVERMTRCLRELREHVKSVKPSAYVAANCQPFRSLTAAGNLAVDMIELAQLLDIVINQNEFYPKCRNDCITSRIRELKMARELRRVVVSLCDSNAMMTPEQEKYYALPLYEDAVFGGVPTDRTVMSPKATPGFIDREKFARRQKLLKEFNAFVEAHRADFKAPTYQPVRLFYPYKELQFSVSANRSLVAAEEVLTRRQIPWGYLISRTNRPFEVPEGTEVIVVAGQTSLSEVQIECLVAWAKNGGKLVVTGDAGRYNEFNAQRLENPFLQQLNGLPNVVRRETPDQVSPASIAWTMNVGVPSDHGERLVTDLSKTGFKLPFSIMNCPETMAVDVRKTNEGFIFHFVNYNPSVTARGVNIRFADNESVIVPDVIEYALVRKDAQRCSESKMKVAQ